MKKIITIFALFLAGIGTGVSQPNGGFEDWVNEFTYETPVGWQTLNFLQFTLPPNPISAFKATGIDRHSGNYALKLKSIHLNNNPAPELLDDTMGACFTGKVNISPTYYKYGFPHTSRSEKLTFWYKYFPVGADEGGVRVILTRWNGVKRDTLAFNESHLYQNTSYSQFELNIDYLSNEQPDTAVIFIGSSRHHSVARVGSTLYVDDVAFTGWVGVEENALLKPKVFPNPAKEYITFSDITKEADAIEITDIMGKALARYPLKGSVMEVNTSSLTDGTYIYLVRDKSNKLLSKGKFSVVR